MISRCQPFVSEDNIMNPLRTAWTSLKLLCLMAYVVSLAHPAQAQTVNTQVTLSCNDGHSVIFDVDQITLTSLADVQAINASGTGTSCTLTTAAIDPSSETTEWTVYDYNPSNQANRAAELTELTAGNNS